MKNKKWYKGVPIGIKDIDGKDICEGDTVNYWKVGEESKVVDEVVKYSEDLCAFTLFPVLWLQLASPLKIEYQFKIQENEN
jgi:hypothetical protein